MWLYGLTGISFDAIMTDEPKKETILNPRETRIAKYCILVTSLFWLVFGASFMTSYIISKHYEERYAAMSLCFGDKNCALKLVKGMDGKSNKRGKGGS